MNAWIIRAGRDGEREQVALDNSIATVGWKPVPDMSGATTKDAVRAMVDVAYPDHTINQRGNSAGQLWAFRGLIEPGDLILMPMKTTKRLALGTCTSGYFYRADEPDLQARHTIEVEWKNTDVSRAALKDDLLNTINGAMTVFQATKNNAEERLRAVMDGGVDPGSHGGVAAAQPAATAVAQHLRPGAEDVVDPSPAPTLEAIRDRVRTHLVENFGQHKLTHLVAEILRVLGCTCEVSPEGPDFGVDIIAGRGPLGLDRPTLIVEVKSEQTPIGSPIVRGLRGAISSHKADHGLLVAWGGLSKPAVSELRTDRLSLRVWDADIVLDRLFEVYDRLPDDTRARIPLKQAWVLNEESG